MNTCHNRSCLADTAASSWCVYPPEVHRKLALEAAEEGVSLNRVVSSKLASA